MSVNLDISKCCLCVFLKNKQKVLSYCSTGLYTVLLICLKFSLESTFPCFGKQRFSAYGLYLSHNYTRLWYGELNNPYAFLFSSVLPL